MNQEADSQSQHVSGTMQQVEGVILQWQGEDKAPWAKVVLSNPGKLNAMSVRMWRQLRQVFLQINEHPRVRCVVLTGAGQAFCAGGDISEYAGFRFEESSLRDFHEQDVWGGLSAILACDVPILASIHGACMGAGVELASCCDIRLASRTAQFGAPIAKLGFPMAPRELDLVRRAAGSAMARRMLLGAEVVSADTLLASGFLAQSVEADVLDDVVLRWQKRLTQLAPHAARATKQMLRQLEQGAAVPDLLANAYAYAPSEEHREGVQAFIEKRSPRF